MIPVILHVFGVFLVVFGIFLCGLLLWLPRKAHKAMWLVTVPGVVMVALLDFEFVCHPLLLLKLSEFWVQKRAQAIAKRPPVV